jgi:hypothetical protein
VSSENSFKFRFFLPDTRLLSNEEIESLPADKLRTAEAAGRQGLWLEISCPDRSCLDEQGRITLPTHEAEGKGTWLKLFCPEGSCEMAEATDVP